MPRQHRHVMSEIHLCGLTPSALTVAGVERGSIVLRPKMERWCPASIKTGKPCEISEFEIVGGT